MVSIIADAIDVEASIETLKEARSVLLEDSCATENGDGHSETAEKFIAHIESCQECMEEVSIQFLITEGMNRLEQGDTFELKKELETIRKRGYSLDNEEYGHGIICISAPIFDHTRTAIGVIGCSLSTVYCSVEEIYDRCGQRLMQTAEQISKCMGYLL